MRTTKHCILSGLFCLQAIASAEVWVTTAVDENDFSSDPSLGSGTSLREALLYSLEETVLFAPGLSGATLTLSEGEILLWSGSDKELDASALEQAPTIEANGSNRLFTVPSSVTFTIRGVVMQGGRALSDDPNNIGGAILVEGGLEVYDSLFHRNEALFGGAIGAKRGASVEMLGTILEGNSALFAGGAIANENAMVSLNLCTLTRNEASSGGGIYVSESGQTLLANSILAGNTAGSTAPDLRQSNGFITTEGRNLFSSLEGNTLSASSSLIVAEPRLAPLASYGNARIPFTPPLPGSPAIDQSTGLGFGYDIRGAGAARFNGELPDLGAVELYSYTVDTTTDGGSGSLRTGLASGGLISAIEFDASLDGERLLLTSGELSSIHSVAITGYGLAGGLTLDANGAETNHRVLRVNGGNFIFLEDLVLRGGRTVGTHEDNHSGGGILNRGDLQLDGCRITANRSSQHGGGIEHQGGLLEIVDSQIDQNHANKDGGGVSGRWAGRIDLLRSRIDRNVSAKSGGGARVYQTALNADQSAFTNNRAEDSGGGANWFNAKTSTVRNTTFAANVSGYSAAGLYNSSTTLTLVHCTIAANYSEDFIGGIANSGTLTLQNTVIQGNRIANTRGRDIFEYSSSSISLEGVNSISHIDGDTDLQAGSQLIVGDARLAPLENYGGPTPSMAPLPNSPLIDAAGSSSLAVDQTGAARSVGGGPDIGATEYDATHTLPRILSGDSDGDGVPYGIEIALGLDPTRSDANSPRNLQAPTMGSGGIPSISFSVDPEPELPLVLSMMRADSLSDNGFNPVYEFRSDSLQAGVNGIYESREGEQVTLNDYSTNEGQAFYRLRVRYQP